MAINFLAKVDQLFGEDLGYFEEHDFKEKTVVAAFGANFGNLWAVFIPSSGHTDYKLATFSTGKMLRWKGI